LNKIIAYLRDNVSAKHTLESLSEAHSIHSSHISRLFANHLGTNFSAYLTKLRMEEAAKLLKTTQKDIKEIYGLCGFGDYFYFCRVFRKYYACTPSVFREATQ
jgi:two-component system response regulator YesN